MALFIIAVIIIAAIVWGIIGYRKGAPHGLAKEGVMYSMIGIVGMRKLDGKIREKQAADRLAAKQNG